MNYKVQELWWKALNLKKRIVLSKNIKVILCCVQLLVEFLQYFASPHEVKKKKKKKMRSHWCLSVFAISLGDTSGDIWSSWYLIYMKVAEQNLPFLWSVSRTVWHRDYTGPRLRALTHLDKQLPSICHVVTALPVVFNHSDQEERKQCQRLRIRAFNRSSSSIQRHSLNYCV